jgi:hypothetical protein
MNWRRLEGNGRGLEGLRKPTKMPQLGHLVSRPGFKPITSRIQVESVTSSRTIWYVGEVSSFYEEEIILGKLLYSGM